MSTSNNRPRAEAKIQFFGELKERLNLNFDRLEQDDYKPQKEYIAPDWPGDFVGRLIQALSYLVRVTGRKAKYLDQLVRELPGQFNAKGYLGEVLEGFDEQQLSGHGWLVAGLVEYWKLTGDKSALESAVRITENLFLPLTGRISSYPRRLDQRVIGGSYEGTIAAELAGWRLSTDIGCAFISLEGIVPLAIETGREDLKALVREMFGVYESMDLIEVSAQLHSSLSAAGMFLKYHTAFGHPGMLAVARRSYQLFRTTAITENYANYNWFRRPTWTEPCAIVDSIVLALGLWRATGESHYLDDVHHIYFNAMGYAQKPHGGFGCDNCVGAEATYLVSRFFDPVGCCNMRGGVGLSVLADHVYLHALDDSLTIGFYFDSKAELDFADGKMIVIQETQYPLAGRVSVKVESSTCQQQKTLRLFIPPWADWTGLEIKINGKPVVAVVVKNFMEITSLWKSGDRVDLAFPIVLRTQQPLNPNTFLKTYTYRHGPLVLGVYEAQGGKDREGLEQVKPGQYQAPGSNGITLAPLTDIFRLTESQALHDRKKVLFRSTAQ
jgi:DUF1680 family protein